jgi:hypothetical protein
MITLHSLRWSHRELHTRLPFRFGIAVMTQVPHVWLEIEATIDGERVVGQSADHLPPKWFTKNPDGGVEDEIEEMRLVLAKAGEWATGRSAATVHALVHQVSAKQDEWAGTAGIPPLLANFGVTFVERALIDAYCRRHGATVGAVLRDNRLGVELGDLHPELAGMSPSEGLPAASLEKVASRHTVGLADPLEESDIPDDERPVDDLPVSLRAVCRHYQLHDFKIKVAGEPGAALDRLERIVRLIEEETGGNYVTSIDGNETFTSIEPFREFWELARKRKGLAGLWSRLMFVEQPLHRAQSLDDGVGVSLASWAEHPPMLIDESGATAGDLRRALDLGYIGVSHKNCKGVIHGVANRCLLARRMQVNPGLKLQMSGEDLSNVGPIALTQDLAVQAALGNASVERNGHHYFAGLSGWPKTVWSQAMATYPGLYDVGVDGYPQVQVKAGRLDLAAVNRNAFGGTTMKLADAGEVWLEQS